jgi:hypothetical protein
VTPCCPIGWSATRCLAQHMHLSRSAIVATATTVLATSIFFGTWIHVHLVT